MELDAENNSTDYKLKDIDQKILILQDIIFKLKINFDLLLKSQTDKEIYSQVIKSTETMLNKFLDDRPDNCELINQCTTLAQKEIMKILRVFLNSGNAEAGKLIDRFLNSSNKYYENGNCPNVSCLNNAKQIVLSLKEFLDKIDQNRSFYSRDYLNYEKDYEFQVGNETKESKLMSALGNELRLKILKELSKGSNHYTHLERTLGLKGGHFRFHLNELINVGLVQIGSGDKRYHITPKGLEALKMIFILNK